MSVTVNGTSGLVFGDGTIQGTAAGNSFRNRIINGDMRIDQWNGGNSISVPTATSQIFPVDRWRCQNLGGSSTTFTAQRVTDAPSGFINSLKITTATSGAVNAADSKHMWIPLEGTTVADFAFGTADAKTITLSFWVKSSITGDFGGSISNDGATRSYNFLYNISTANTWQYKTVTIPGDTTGTWNKDLSAGMRVNFNIGSGSNYIKAAGSWGTGADRGATGQVSLLATSGATWQITGVQLEKAAAATSFEHRPITAEQQLCMRYFVSSYTTGGLLGRHYSSTMAGNVVRLPIPMLSVPMRVQPTITWFHTSTGTAGQLRQFSSAATISVNTSYPDSELGGGYVQLNTDASSNPVPMTGFFNAEL